MTAKGERAPLSAASEEDGMTRSLSGTDLQAERLSGGPNPATITPPSRLYERALTLVAMGFLGEATTVLRDISVRVPGHAPVWKKLAELCVSRERIRANGAMSQAANGSTLWPAASDSRTPAEIVAAERALLERVGALKTPPERLKELRDYLRVHEIDAPAMRVLGRLEQESGNLITARALFERALVRLRIMTTPAPISRFCCWPWVRISAPLPKAACWFPARRQTSNTGRSTPMPCAPSATLTRAFR